MHLSARCALAFLLLSACETDTEKRLRLEQQKAQWNTSFEALPGYSEALAEGIRVAVEDSGMTPEERAKLEAQFGAWDKKKVHAGIVRLCLTLGKILAQNPKADVSQSGIPPTSPALLSLVQSAGFKTRCLELFELERAAASSKKR